MQLINAFKSPRYWLIFVVIVGALLRLWKLGGDSLWYDEAASIYLTQFVDSKGSILNSAHNTEAPLNSMMVAAWLRVLGLFALPATSQTLDFLIRLLPCLLSIAALPLLYLFVRRLSEDEWSALLATAILAVSPFYIYYAQELRVYSFLNFMSLIALLLFLRLLDHGRKQDFFFLGLTFLLLLYAHFISVWFIFTLNLYVLFRLYKQPRLLLPWTLMMLTVIACAIPAILLALRMNDIVSSIGWQWYPRPRLATTLITFKNFFAGYGFSPISYRPLLLLALGLSFTGCVFLIRKRPWQGFLLLLVLSLPMLLNLVVWRYREFSFYEHRLMMVSGSMAVAAVGIGLRALRFPLATACAFSGILALMLPGIFDYYRHMLHPSEEHRLGVFDKVDFRNAAKAIQEEYQPGDVIVHNGLFTIYSMKYYLPGAHVHLAGGDEDRGLYLMSLGTAHNNEAMLDSHGLLPVDPDDALANVDRAWLVDAQGLVFDTQPQSRSAGEVLLGRGFVAKKQLQYDGVTVALYERETIAPSVVMILVDTLRADHVEANFSGVPIMPKLTAFATDALHFERAYTPSSWTRSAMASVLTSTAVDAHGVKYSIQGESLDNPTSDKLPDELETMAEYFRAHDYETFGIQTNANVFSAFGFAQGYNDVDHVEMRNAKAAPVTDRALEAFRRMQRPSFLYIHYLDPHVPYMPPADYLDLYPKQEMPDAVDETILAGHQQFMTYYMDCVNRMLGLPVDAEVPKLSQAGTAEVRRRYAAECRYLDDELARLIRGVRLSQPRSIIVITSDHGEEFWERGGMGHGTNLFEEQLQVPLNISAPGLSPMRVSAPVSTLGVLPTMAALAGLEHREQWQGESLLNSATSPIFARTYGPWSKLEVNEEIVLDGEWKLRKDHALGLTQLFDLAADANECHDVASQETERVGAMESLLAEEAALNTQTRESLLSEEDETTLDAEAQANLEALGYLGAETKDSSEAALTDEQKAELEALGYLDSSSETSAPRRSPHSDTCGARDSIRNE